MSRGIVNQKPFSRKKRKQSFKKMLNRSGIEIPQIKISKKIKNILSRGMLFTVVIICGIVFIIKASFFKPEQNISEIKISQNTLGTYQDIELFNFISEEVKGKNYFILSSNKDELLSKVQKKFPFVGKIDFQLEQKEETGESDENKTTDEIIVGVDMPNKLPMTTGYKKVEFPLKISKNEEKAGGTLGIEIIYIEPRILVKLNDKKFAVRSEQVFTEVKEGMLISKTKIDPNSDDNTIGNLKEIFTVETPLYLSGTNKLDGFFFEISLPKMIEISSLAEKEFGDDMLRFVYLAGSTRFAIFINGYKTLYFNFPEGGDVKQQWETQIFKYNKLKEKYPDFNNLENIDLGALEDNKTIIKYY